MISVSRNGEEIGAWPEAEVRRLYARGDLLPTDHFWREGMAEWQVLESLFPAVPGPSQPPPVPPELRAKSRSFEEEESPASWIAPLVLAFVLSVLLGPIVPHAQANVRMQTVEIGTALFFGIPFLISLLFVRRWRLLVRCGGTVIFFILAFAADQPLQMAIVKSENNARRQKEIEAQFRSYADQNRQEAAREIAKNGYVKADPAKTAAALAKLKALSAGASGNLKKMTDLSLEMAGQLASRVKVSQVAEEKMKALGLQPVWMTSVEEIEKRRAALAACQPPVVDVQNYLQNLEGFARAKLEGEGVDSFNVDSFIGGMKKGGHLEAMITYWKQESVILTDLYDTLGVLKDDWGRWKVNNNEYIFDDNATLALYQANQKNWRRIPIFRNWRRRKPCRPPRVSNDLRF